LRPVLHPVSALADHISALLGYVCKPSDRTVALLHKLCPPLLGFFVLPHVRGERERPVSDEYSDSATNEAYSGRLVEVQADDG